MKKPATQLLFAIVLFLSANIQAQDGSLDATFNIGTGVNGVTIIDVSAAAIQSDGKIIIVGYFTSYDGTARNHIARLNTDGSLDVTFNVGTGTNSVIYTTAIQSDGKIIIGGDFTTYNGIPINDVARLNTDGSLDATFIVGTGATNSGVNNYVQTTAIQNDGKIIISGNFTNFNGTDINKIARLNTDGSVDASYNIGTGGNERVYTTAMQSDEKIIIGGVFTAFNGTAKNYIGRLNTDGSVDPTFDVGTGTDNYVYTTSVQSDGKVIIGGLFTTYNGTTLNRIVRLNIDGSLDATFNVGTGANGALRTIAIQGDGKIIIGGDFTSYNSTSINHICRLNTDGSLDPTFNVGTGTDKSVNTISIQGDGKVIFGGDFTTYNGTGRNRIARLNNLITGVVNHNSAMVSLSIFPNPNNGDFTISLHKEETFSLINNLGQIVQTIELNQSNNNSANITGIESGVYFLMENSYPQLKYKIAVAK
jgi:uncharacterized delta-60 repeat protein